MDRLRDKVAIITGAGMGIAKNMALLFAEEGAKLGLLDVKEAELKQTATEIKKRGGEVYTVVGDVRRYEDVEKWVKTAVDKYGRVDIQANIAGLQVGGAGPEQLYDVPDNAWNTTLDVNLKGVWLCCKAVVPYMIKQKKGKIINMGSCLSLVGAVHNIPYIVSKHAVLGLSRTLAVHLAPKGINVNCLCPAEVNTPLLKQVLDQSGTTLEEMTKSWSIGHIGPVPMPMEAVSNVALFLASDDSDYLYGRAIHVGGWTALIP
jgi:NAD(P)-dependent dehydrogenase (short-subunit alcohol dehydrogenase family)